jgi:hypothetical protein
MCEKDLDCDLLIVIGTSFSVDGVKKIVKTFCKGPNSEGKRILVNLTKLTEKWESYFDYFYEGDCIDFVNDLKKVTAGKQVKKLEVLKVDRSISNETDASAEIYQSETIEKAGSVVYQSETVGNAGSVVYQAKSLQCQADLVENDRFKIEMEQINQQTKSVCNLADGHYINILDIGEIRRLSISTEPNGMKTV